MQTLWIYSLWLSISDGQVYFIKYSGIFVYDALREHGRSFWWVISKADYEIVLVWTRLVVTRHRLESNRNPILCSHKYFQAHVIDDKLFSVIWKWIVNTILRTLRLLFFTFFNLSVTLFQNFQRQSSLLFKILTNVRGHNVSSHLAKLQLRLDFNKYYSNSGGQLGK